MTDLGRKASAACHLRSPAGQQFCYYAAGIAACIWIVEIGLALLAVNTEFAGSEFYAACSERTVRQVEIPGILTMLWIHMTAAAAAGQK